MFLILLSQLVEGEGNHRTQCDINTACALPLSPELRPFPRGIFFAPAEKCTQSSITPKRVEGTLHAKQEKKSLFRQ